MDCDTLWNSLINEKVPTIPKIECICRETIYKDRTQFVYLISSSCNLADAMTKQKPDKASLVSLQINLLYKLPMHVFMLQKSRFCHPQYIPTTVGPMPDNGNKSS